MESLSQRCCSGYSLKQLKKLYDSIAGQLSNVVRHKHEIPSTNIYEHAEPEAIQSTARQQKSSCNYAFFTDVETLNSNNFRQDAK